MQQFGTLKKLTIQIAKDDSFSIEKVGKTEGYDGHSLRTYAYFGDQMPDIEPTVASINSIQTKYKGLRTKQKAPSFALQYGGTWRTVMNSAGLPEEESKQIEANYHKLYVVSDEWVKSKLDQAHTDGYVTCAFGLKVRTPILAKTPLTSRLPYPAVAERRSAGNAVSGQSYGLLNSRAGIELQERTLASKHRLNVLPVAQIHDATYLLVRDNPEVVKWVNDNLIDCMRWCDLPELQHDEVKLGAELDLFFPSWKDALTLPNYISVEEIKELAINHKKEISE